MAVSLKKGQGISLKKTENDLSMVTVGLGWDVNASVAGGSGLFARMMNKKPAEDYDLDVVAFLCGADGKVHDLGSEDRLVGGDVVFFNSLRHPSGDVWLTGDNRTGAGDGDDEQLIARLNDLPGRYAKIALVLQIYQGEQRGQTLNHVRNAYIRAVAANGREMARFVLSGDSLPAGSRSMLFAELVREASGWKFNAIGEAAATDSFVIWLKRYI